MRKTMFIIGLVMSLFYLIIFSIMNIQTYFLIHYKFFLLNGHLLLFHIFLVAASLVTSFGLLYEKIWARYIYNVLTLLLVLSLVFTMFSTYKSKGYVPLDTATRFGITLEMWDSASNKALIVQSLFLIITIVMASLGLRFSATKKNT